jgi:alkanesulfonate monooxygenase SsuD/methylene tetrahydromethanopterin reductase-like flavin-dependent oxidoreductase (luciferase family)
MKSSALMAKQRDELDRALLAEKRDPDRVGILWSSRAIVGETESEAAALRESLIAKVPPEAVGVWLSHNTGYDMSQLPPRFSLAELQQRIVAANASRRLRASTRPKIRGNS